MRISLLSLAVLALLASCNKHKHNPEAPTDKPTKKVVRDAVPLALSDGQLVLPIPIQFAGAGSTEVTPESVPMLEHVKSWLNQNRDTTLLRVEVHSDGDGSARESQALTQARALALCKRLVSLGADCKRVLPVGFGGTKPVADGSTPDGKAKNRRVEFRPAELRGKPLGGMPIDGGGQIAGDPCAK